MILRYMKKIFIFPVVFLLTVVLFIFTLALLTALIIPIFLYKHLVILIAKCVFPGSKILCDLDNIMAKGNIYIQSDMYLSLQLILEGRLDVQDLLEEWNEKIMKKTRENGSLMFPELRSYVQTLMGYSFYTLDKSFDLKNHIKRYNNQDSIPGAFVDRKKLDEIRSEYVKNVFKKERSPWELLVINNYRISEDEETGKEYSAVIFKYHHCLADGYATLLLFWEAIGGQKLNDMNQPKSASLKLSFTKKIGAILLSFYHYAVCDGKRIFNFLYSWDKFYDKNSWHNNKLKSDMVTSALNPIPSKMVKEISQEHNISITAAILAVCTGGFRRMMIAKGFSPPKTIRSAFSLPLPNHPKRLTTYSFVSEFEVPISNLDDAKRLKLTNRNISNNVRSSLLISARLAKLFLFSLPLSWPTKVKTPSGDSLFFSSVGLQKPIHPSGVPMCNCTLMGTYVCCDLSGIQNLGMQIIVLKYKDDFFVNFGIQKYLLNNKNEIYELDKYIMDELNHLHQVKKLAVV